MKIRRYQGVTAATGLPGSGKSYYLAEQAVKAQKKGIPVYSNAGFDVKGTRTIDSFEAFAGLTGPAVVVWDELPLYFSSRKWGDFPDGMLYKFTQIRKDGIQLYYSTIHELMVDITLRRITFNWIEHRHLAGRLVRRTHYPPREMRNDGAGSYYKQIVVMRKSVMAAYDTMGRVAVNQPDRLEGLPLGSWSKPKWAEPDGSRLRVAGSPPDRLDSDQDIGTEGAGPA